MNEQSKLTCICWNPNYLVKLSNMREEIKDIKYPHNLFFGMKCTYENSLYELMEDSIVGYDDINLLEIYAWDSLGLCLQNKKDDIIDILNNYSDYINMFIPPNNDNKFIDDESCNSSNANITYFDLLHSINSNPQIMFSCITRFDAYYASALVSLYTDFIIKFLPKLQEIKDFMKLVKRLASKKIAEESFTSSLYQIGLIIHRCHFEDNYEVCENKEIKIKYIEPVVVVE